MGRGLLLARKESIVDMAHYQPHLWT